MSLHHAASNRGQSRPGLVGTKPVRKSFDDEEDAYRNELAEHGDQPFPRRFRARPSRAKLDHDHYYYHHDDHNHGVGGDRRLAKFKQEYQLTAPRSRNRKRGFLFGVSDHETGL